MYYPDFVEQTKKEKRQIIPCFAGRIGTVIDVHGNVFPCELYKKMGNLKDYNFNFKELWFSEQAEKVKKEIKDGKCYCTHSCFHMLNTMFNLKNYPRLIKYMF